MSHSQLDVAIDGADEVDPDFNLVKVIIFCSVLNPQHPFSPYVATAFLPYVSNRILCFVCFFSHSHFPFFPKGGGGALLREKMVEVGVNSDPN